MSLSPCAEPLCPNLVPRGQRGRCPEHRKERDREIKRLAKTPGYKTQGWQRLRRRVLERDGYRCRECGRMADQVDHIVPVRLGGAQFDMDNCQSLCASCHSKKTAREPRERPFSL
jgi:5-methylcytosine-specific restriction endonuclease McrA